MFLSALSRFLLCAVLAGLSASLHAATASIGTAGQVKGNAKWVDAKGAQHPLKTGDAIGSGSKIITSKGSLLLVLEEGTRIALSQGSNLRINAPASNGKNKDKTAAPAAGEVSLQLTSGNARIATPESSKGLSVSTANGSVRVEGVVDVISGDRATAVVLQSGSAEVTAAACRSNCQQSLTSAQSALLAQKTKSLAKAVAANGIAMNQVRSKAAKGQLLNGAIAALEAALPAAGAGGKVSDLVDLSDASP